MTTNGTYTGIAAGDADFTGNATLRATSLINTTDNIGLVSGTLRIDVASGRDTQAQFYDRVQRRPDRGPRDRSCT